jgi:predicted RNA-binding protein YlxR (DUF448 family)
VRIGSRRTATQPEPDPSEDDTDDTKESGPLRRCLVLRQSFARETMLRFVVGPEQKLFFDVGATLPGRGLWLSASRDVVEMSVKRGVFSRAAKQQVNIPPDLRASVEAALTQRIFDLVGLARRSGGAISGFEKAREWLVSGKAGLVMQAMDGSPEERARFMGARDVPVVTMLTSAALGRIFGREQTVHAVIAAGPLAVKIQNEVLRHAGVAGGNLSGQ